MLAALTLALALLAGLAWAAHVPGRLLLPERVAGGVVAGVLGGAWVAFLLVLTQGFAMGMALTPVALAAIAAPGLVRLARRRRAATAALPWGERGRRARQRLRTARLPRPLAGWWLAATAAATALLAFLDSTHFLPDRDGGMGSAGSSWGDLALHTSLTARFAQEPRFEWGFPLLSGAPLTYPFLPDFLSGVLARGGLSLRWSLLLPTLLLGAALVQLLFFAGWRAGRGRRAALLVLLLVLLDGSLAGLVVLAREWPASGAPFLQYLQDIRHDFAHVPDINVRFSNIICDALLPQRGMLFGLSAFLLAALLLRAGWDRQRRSGGGALAPLLAAGAVLGALPFVHIHTFLVLAGLIGWLGAAQAVAAWRAARGGGAAVAANEAVRDAGRAALPWLAALLLGVALAAPQLGWQLSQSFGGSFSRWKLGWMTATGEDPFFFWFKNLGVLMPFLVLAPGLLQRWPARSFWTQLCAACLAIFALANVYLFQPHAYDNLKLLFYSYLALALVTARLLAGWWRRGGRWRALAAVVVLLATTSGALSVFRESLLRWPFLTAEEVRLGMELRRLTPPDARFLVADHHNHPVPMVAGRPIVLGYRGWLWTYGFDTAGILADVQRMYAGGPEAERLLRRYRVDYVVIGPGERQAFAVDEPFFAGRYPLLVATEGYRVYRVDAGGGAGGADDAAGTGGAAGAPTNTGASAGTLPAKRSTSK